MAKLRAAEATHQDYENVNDSTPIPGLFAPGGPFESFPGAAVIVGRNGIILGANQGAGPLLEVLRGDAPAELREAIDLALGAKVAQVAPLLVETDGEPAKAALALDLVALPWVEGAAVVLLGRDITLERSVRMALIDSRQRYKDLVETSSDLAWETDGDGRFVFVSPHGSLGYRAGQLVGARAQDFQIGAAESGASPFAARSAFRDQEIWYRRADDQVGCLVVSGVPLFTPSGAWCGARGVCRDVTEQRLREEELNRARHRERLLAYILRSLRDEPEPVSMLQAAAAALIPALPARGVIIYRRGEGRGLRRVTHSGGPPPGAPLDGLLQAVADGRDEAEAALDGKRLLILAARLQGDWNGALCLWRDAADPAWSEDERFLLREISAQVAVANGQLAREEKLERLSSTDPLTGLLNRRSFLQALDEHFAQADRRRKPAALLYVDCDNFKLVNDRHGHRAGDEALVKLAQILRDHSRSGDLVARLGGDEFGLFLPGISASAVAGKGRDLVDAAAELAALSGAPEAPLGLSVGVAIYDPERPEDVQSLVQRGDEAMYRVKRDGKGGVHVAPEPARPE